MSKIDQIIGTTQQREMRADAGAIDTENRSIELAFSSAEPVDRWFGREILDHSAGSIRMDRIRDGAPLLLQHDPDRQIGVVESSRLDGDGVARARVRFSAGALGQEIMQDVADGIRSKVSVGYRIHSMMHESTVDGVETYRVDDWEPLEISIVSIPADNSVGVGRSITHEDHPMAKEALDNPVEREEALPEPTKPEMKTEERKLDTPANPDADQIRAIGRHFDMARQAEDHIMLGGNLEDFRQMIRDAKKAERQDIAPVTGRVPYAGNLNAFRADIFGGRQQAEEMAYRAGQWAKATIFGDESAARWCRDHGVQISQRTLTGMGAGQSVVVPEEMSSSIISLREQYGIARRLCNVQPMMSDTLSVPRDAGDVTAYFVGRESAPTASDPAFDNINLTAKNVAVETRIANDYAADSVINLAEYVAEKHARAFAIKEDECLINGDGTSTYGGIVGLRTAILGLAGAVDGASGNDTFAEITATDLRNVMAKLPDIPGINPSWICSKVAQNTLFGRLLDAAGGNTKRELSSAMPEQYAGYAIQTSASMPKVLTDLSDVAMVLFGDLRMGVVFGDRRGMTMLVDPYSLSSYQQTKLISSERFDINCHGVGDASNPGPIVALIGE